MGVAVLTMAGIEAVRRWHPVDPADSARLLMIATSLQALSTFVFALAINFPTAVGAYWAATVLRRMRGPIFSAWLNRGIDPRVRATVLSMAGQADAAGQILGAPLVGVVGSLWSIRAGLVVAGLALAPAVGLYWRAHRLADPEGQQAGDAAG